MIQQDKLLPDYKGRARGLIKILDEERQRCNRLWVTTCPTHRHGRVEMVAQNEQTSGCGHGQSQTLGS